ncbi:MAG: hypothetical protein WD231_03435 [Candidatus Woykebacteria bacterium]
MIFLFIFLDVTSVLFGVSLGVLTGEKLGEELVPNILILVFGFFAVRTLLYWVLFRSVVNRDMPWNRNILQSLFFLAILPLLFSILVALPSALVKQGSGIFSAFLFFANLNGSIFYFIVVPAVALAASFGIHKIYKIENW